MDSAQDYGDDSFGTGDGMTVRFDETADEHEDASFDESAHSLRYSGPRRLNPSTDSPGTVSPVVSAAGSSREQGRINRQTVRALLSGGKVATATPSGEAEGKPTSLSGLATVVTRANASTPWRTTKYALIAQRVYRERAFRFDRCREAVTRAVLDATARGGTSAGDWIPIWGDCPTAMADTVHHGAQALERAELQASHASASPGRKVGSGGGGDVGGSGREIIVDPDSAGSLPTPLATAERRRVEFGRVVKPGKLKSTGKSSGGMDHGSPSHRSMNNTKPGMPTRVGVSSSTVARIGLQGGSVSAPYGDRKTRSSDAMGVSTVEKFSSNGLPAPYDPETESPEARSRPGPWNNSPNTVSNAVPKRYSKPVRTTAQRSAIEIDLRSAARGHAGKKGDFGVRIGDLRGPGTRGLRLVRASSLIGLPTSTAAPSALPNTASNNSSSTSSNINNSNNSSNNNAIINHGTKSDATIDTGEATATTRNGAALAAIERLWAVATNRTGQNLGWEAFRELHYRLHRALTSRDEPFHPGHAESGARYDWERATRHGSIVAVGFSEFYALMVDLARAWSPPPLTDAECAAFVLWLVTAISVRQEDGSYMWRDGADINIWVGAPQWADVDPSAEAESKGKNGSSHDDRGLTDGRRTPGRPGSSSHSQQRNRPGSKGHGKHNRRRGSRGGGGGGDHYAADSGVTDIFMACEIGSVSDVERLVALGATATMRSLDGETPLHVACRVGQEPVVSALLRLLPVLPLLPQNRRGETPLHVACLAGHGDVARVLLEGKFGHPTIPPLQRHSHEETGESAIGQRDQQQQHPQQTRSSLQGENPPKVKAAPQRVVSTPSAALEIDARSDGAGIDTRDHRGRTALHIAASAGQSMVDTTVLLLRHGADPTLPDAHGNTPVHCAVAAWCLQGVKAMVETAPEPSLCQPPWKQGSASRTGHQQSAAVVATLSKSEVQRRLSSRNAQRLTPRDVAVTLGFRDIADITFVADDDDDDGGDVGDVDADGGARGYYRGDGATDSLGGTGEIGASDGSQWHHSERGASRGSARSGASLSPVPFGERGGGSQEENGQGNGQNPGDIAATTTTTIDGAVRLAPPTPQGRSRPGSSRGASRKSFGARKQQRGQVTAPSVRSVEVELIGDLCVVTVLGYAFDRATRVTLNGVPFRDLSRARDHSTGEKGLWKLSFATKPYPRPLEGLGDAAVVHAKHGVESEAYTAPFRYVNRPTIDRVFKSGPTHPLNCNLAVEGSNFVHSPSVWINGRRALNVSHPSGRLVTAFARPEMLVPAGESIYESSSDDEAAGLQGMAPATAAATTADDNGAGGGGGGGGGSGTRGRGAVRYTVRRIKVPDSAWADVIVEICGVYSEPHHCKLSWVLPTVHIGDDGPFDRRRRKSRRRRKQPRDLGTLSGTNTWRDSPVSPHSYPDPNTSTRPSVALYETVLVPGHVRRAPPPPPPTPRVHRGLEGSSRRHHYGGGYHQRHIHSRSSPRVNNNNTNNSNKINHSGNRNGSSMSQPSRGQQRPKTTPGRVRSPMRPETSPSASASHASSSDEESLATAIDRLRTDRRRRNNNNNNNNNNGVKNGAHVDGTFNIQAASAISSSRHRGGNVASPIGSGVLERCRQEGMSYPDTLLESTRPKRLIDAQVGFGLPLTPRQRGASPERNQFGQFSSPQQHQQRSAASAGKRRATPKKIGIDPERQLPPVKGAPLF